jgi:hypothetical protein
MQMNLWKINHIALTGGLLLILSGCQPPQSSITDLDPKQASRIKARTVPVQEANQVVCEIEGCVRFDLRTIDSNLGWIDRYFIERIRRTEPVAFSKVTSNTIRAKDQPKFMHQRLIQVSFLNQHGHLASFIFKSSHLPRSVRQPLSYIEYVNLDLKRKKRLALDEILLEGAQPELLQALYQEHQNWLDQTEVKKQQLRLSDNYYFGTQGLVLVYPPGELSQAVQQRAELNLSYANLTGIIRPEYLSLFLPAKP